MNLPRLHPSPARRFPAALALLFLAGLSAFTPLFPQARETGSVEGRVQNAVTGRYLNNARISVQGTNRIALTDESGSYRLANVPSGNAVIEVLYSGLDKRQIPVVVPKGGTVVQNVDLTNVSAYGTESAVRLDPFTVAAGRETDAAVIAINEQRFASNIKNVVSTDTHGEVMGGNLGQFLKYVPGVMEDVGGFEPEGILVRGFPTNLTVFTSDGAPLANGGGSRSFTLEQIAINNVSRVEVTKVPTPATGADSMAGSINMISKSSFERAGAELRYNLHLTGNGNEFYFNKRANPFEDRTYRVVPGATFDYTLPLTKNLGIVVAGVHFEAFVPQIFANRTFNSNAANTGASFARPYLQTFQLQDSPQTRERNSGSVRVDWRPRPKSVLSAGVQSSYYRQISQNYNFNAGAGNNPTPTIAGGTPFSYGDDFTIGATGRGTIGQSAGFNMRNQSLVAGDIRYRYDDGTWRVDALVSGSLGKSWTRSKERGYFGGFTTAAKVPVRVTFRDINDLAPGTTEVFTNANQPFDIYDINNFDLTAASTSTNDRRDDMLTGMINAKRSINMFSFPLSVQVGGARKVNSREQINGNESFTYNGINGDRSAAAFAAKVYVDQKRPTLSSVERAGSHTPAYASPHYGFAAMEKTPGLFTMTDAQVVTSARNRATSNVQIEETVDAWYFQTEMRLFNNKLNVLTGVRYEETTDRGAGPLMDPDGPFLRNPNGAFVRDAAGNRVRRPEAGAAGSLAEVPFTHQTRAARSNRSYDGYYPSLHLTYNVTERFLVRGAYARTYGRPNFNLIIPNSTIDENDQGNIDDPNIVPGTISVRNTGLLPWTADNYDISLEYYTDSGGLFGASVFSKDIKNFFGTFNRIATANDLAALGLPTEYAGWQMNTTINSGNASVRGMEISGSHELRGLTSWGQYFRVFANATKIELRGNRDADFSGFLPKTANLGITFSKKPFIVMTKWSWRAKQRTTPNATFGPDGYNHLKSITHLDLNIDYRFRRNMSLYVNARNFFNVPVQTLRYGSQTPDYAKVGQTKDYGAIFTIGLKGTY